MSLPIACPRCKYRFSALATMVGHSIACPQCGAGCPVIAAAPTAAVPTAAKPAATAAPAPRVAQPATLAAVPAAAPAAIPAARAVGGPPGLAPAAGSSPMTGLYIILGGVGVGTIVAGILTWVLFFRQSSGELLAYLPDHSQIVAFMDVRGITSSAGFARLQREFPQIAQMSQQFGMRLEDIDRVAIGGSLGGTDPVVVLQTVGNMTAARFKGSRNMRTENVGGHTLYVGAGGPSFCLVDDQTCVMGNASDLRGVLRRNRSAELSREMAEAVELVEGSHHVAMVIDGKNARATLPAGVAPAAGEMPKWITLVGTLRSDVHLEFSAGFSGEATARKFYDQFVEQVGQVQNQADLPPGVAALLKIVHVTQSGTTVHGDVSLELDDLLALVPR